MHKKNWKKQEKITEGRIYWILLELSRWNDLMGNWVGNSCSKLGFVFNI